MDPQNYTVEDFLADESFQQYCAGTNEQAAFFWSEQLKKYPGIEKTFEEAINWYNILSTGQGNLQDQAGRLKQRIKLASGEASTRRKLREKRIQIKPLLRNWWAAAAIILILSIAGYLIINKISPGKNEVVYSNETSPLKNDLTPGGEKALLTLADGRRIALDSATTGTLAQQGNAKVLKLNNGQLSYQASTGNLPQQIIYYNTVSTPRGGQYQVVLPDGSKVWLNASSSLRFPTAFSGKERRVEITGEAYFEVAKNASMPFKVYVILRPSAPLPGELEGAAAGAEIEVLGTHFNVMAYNDEISIKTTLLEGAVKVRKGNNVGLMKPGQQSQLADNGIIKISDDVDLDQAVAWKNGLFDFENDDIKDIMRQLSRWYDADVEYAGQVTDHYTGTIRRQVNVSQVLHMLELAGGVEFSIKGKKIIVKAK